MSTSTLKVVPAHRKSGDIIHRRAVRIIKSDPRLEYPLRSGQLFTIETVEAVAIRWSKRSIINRDQVDPLVEEALRYRLPAHEFARFERDRRRVRIVKSGKPLTKWIGDIQHLVSSTQALAARGALTQMEALMLPIRAFNDKLLPMTPRGRQGHRGININDLFTWSSE